MFYLKTAPSSLDTVTTPHARPSEEIKKFINRWLAAWTGNNPELLASFYTDDAIYSDPGISHGVKGKEALLGYFEKLLAKPPNWVWESLELIPMESRLLNKWKATIPVGEENLICKGVCLVHIRDEKIYRNDVYCDRSELLEKTKQHLIANVAASKAHL